MEMGEQWRLELHLDLHNDQHLYTTLLILGRRGGDWDRSTGWGDLLLPALGFTLTLYPGDVLFFQPALLLQAVNPLSPTEVTHRTVNTMPNCEPTMDCLDKHCAALGSRPFHPAHRTCLIRQAILTGPRR